MHINIVLTGYYFKYLELYQKIHDETKLYSDYQFSLYILSHKEKEKIPNEFLTFLTKNNWHIIYKPNIGCDWGCHSQFIKWHVENNMPVVDHILFLHDDISIIKNGFIEEFINKASKGFQLIGNSKPFTTVDNFLDKYPEENYILEKNGFYNNSNNIKIVRGSAFFISFELAKYSLLNLPFQKHGKIDIANRSLRMFGAIISTKIGLNKIGYLSTEHFKSKYIVEEMRGKEINSLFFYKRFLNSAASKIFLYLNELLVHYKFLKYNHPIQVDRMLKVNLHDGTILTGYLNIKKGINNSEFSDVSMCDFENLIFQKKIFKIKISNEIAFNDEIWFKKLLQIINLGKGSIDLFLDSSKKEETLMKTFIKNNKKLKINLIKSPRKKGFKWVNQLYINLNN
jgi:hypothetical protein